MYTKLTHNICITIEPIFLDDQSLPFDNQFV